MTNYHTLNQTIITGIGSGTRWIVSDWFLEKNCEGMTIEFQMLGLNDDWETVNEIQMDVDAARVLIQTLSKIKL